MRRGGQPRLGNQLVRCQTKNAFDEPREADGRQNRHAEPAAMVKLHPRK